MSDPKTERAPGRGMAGMGFYISAEGRRVMKAAAGTDGDTAARSWNEPGLQCYILMD